MTTKGLILAAMMLVTAILLFLIGKDNAASGLLGAFGMYVVPSVFASNETAKKVISALVPITLIGALAAGCGATKTRVELTGGAKLNDAGTPNEVNCGVAVEICK